MVDFKRILWYNSSVVNNKPKSSNEHISRKVDRVMNTNETLYNTYVNAQKDNLSKIALFTHDGEAITHASLLNEIGKRTI